MKRYIAIALISPGFWGIIQMPGQKMIRFGSYCWPATEEGRAQAETAAKNEARKRHIAYAGEERI